MDVHFRHRGTDFVWDDAKAAKTLRERGIRFEEAATVFFDPNFKLVDASRNDEARDAVIGFDASARLLFVVHLETEDDQIRIVSARRAEHDEETLYVE